VGGSGEWIGGGSVKGHDADVADVAVLVDLLIAVVEYDSAVGFRRDAVYAALHRAYPVLDRLLGYPPQQPSPTLTLVQDIVYGGADPSRLHRVVNGGTLKTS